MVSVVLLFMTPTSSRDGTRSIGSIRPSRVCHTSETWAFAVGGGRVCFLLCLFWGYGVRVERCSTCVVHCAFQVNVLQQLLRQCRSHHHFDVCGFWFDGHRVVLVQKRVYIMIGSFIHEHTHTETTRKRDTATSYKQVHTSLSSSFDHTETDFISCVDRTCCLSREISIHTACTLPDSVILSDPRVHGVFCCEMQLPRFAVGRSLPDHRLAAADWSSTLAVPFPCLAPQRGERYPLQGIPHLCCLPRA